MIVLMESTETDHQVINNIKFLQDKMVPLKCVSKREKNAAMIPKHLVLKNNGEYLISSMCASIIAIIDRS